ncbi:inositol monophosphatase family protein [Gloeocapsa sp. PCC 73106]|uniref:inositol monophosphatase family protein n=1 Tax=Gloeocapsa sp. PCC 73106 TaxID=102232 RepID=UPI0002AC6F41|nr:inositol monophosphatase family protein [Gloeocapsa sp. PCC 73106]ELR99684.1 inositol monophosphatase/fructose-1,6-bisphosphatase family protein [Gloeocapsa sp. PCC 73106]
MISKITTWEILEALYPTLKLAATYAIAIQQRIKTRPEKTEFGDNFYATALTDADLTIQTAIELVMLAQFPEIRFFGEEYQSSYNTKYFKDINLVEGELLVTLDPVDGTRAYLDGLSTFAIIVTVIRGDRYAGVLIIKPQQGYYLLALRDQGAYRGSLEENQLSLAEPIQLAPLQSTKLYLSFGLSSLRLQLSSDFEVWCSATDYAPPQNPPEYLDLIKGELAGAILERGNLIDSAAIGFVAKEAGAIVTLWDGSDFEPFTLVEPMKIGGIIIAHNPEIHRKIMLTPITFGGAARSPKGGTS